MHSSAASGRTERPGERLVRKLAWTRDGAGYGLGTLYAVASAFLLAVQEPFSALAARRLSWLDFMALTQAALLVSLPFLIATRHSRRDFAAILRDVRQWPKLAVIFLMGIGGLALYDVGLANSAADSASRFLRACRPSCRRMTSFTTAPGTSAP